MGIQKFEFATATKIIFGSGTLLEVGNYSKGFGASALVVLGLENPGSELLLSLLNTNQINGIPFLVQSEPAIELIRQACLLAEDNKCEFVIGYGGGSAIDTAKAVSALLANPGDIYNYLEVIGKGRPLVNPSFPVIAIPTTAGTGAEVTRNAVVSSPAHRIKVSLRSPTMLPTLALIDPELTLDLPASITASTGLDALTQVIEPFVSNQSNPITDALCRSGMQRASRSLRNVFFNGDDLDSRQDMCLVSLFGGLALANAKLGAVHGLAGVIGGMFPGPHGAICARLLPSVIAENVRAIKVRDPAGDLIEKFNEVGRILTHNPDADTGDLIAWIDALCSDLVVPSLSSYGMSERDIPLVVEKSSQTSSMKGNPILLSEIELSNILVKAL